MGELVGVRVGSTEFNPGQGIADTGTSVLVVSPAVMAHFKPLLTSLRCDIPSLPPIVFTLAGGIEVSLGPEQYLQAAFAGNLTEGCLTNLEMQDTLSMSTLSDAPSDDYFVLGDPFFWKYYVAFD